MIIDDGQSGHLTWSKFVVNFEDYHFDHEKFGILAQVSGHGRNFDHLTVVKHR